MDAPPISSGAILRALRARREVADFLGDRPQAFLVGVPDDRHHQTVRRVHGDADMNVLLEDQRFAIGRERCIETGKCKKRARESRDMEASAVSFTSRACASAFQAERRPSMAVTSARS
jgi:hypothetical protein